MSNAFLYHVLAPKEIGKLMEVSRPLLVYNIQPYTLLDYAIWPFNQVEDLNDVDNTFMTDLKDYIMTDFMSAEYSESSLEYLKIVDIVNSIWHPLNDLIRTIKHQMTPVEYSTVEFYAVTTHALILTVETHERGNDFSIGHCERYPTPQRTPRRDSAPTSSFRTFRRGCI